LSIRITIPAVRRSRNWPPAWAAYLAGALRGAGYDDVHFIDAMTDHVDDEALEARIRELKPDVVGTTAITPSIYKAERALEDRQGSLARRSSRCWAASTPPSCTSRC
jgi:hypothetical protein